MLGTGSCELPRLFLHIPKKIYNETLNCPNSLVAVLIKVIINYYSTSTHFECSILQNVLYYRMFHTIEHKEFFMIRVETHANLGLTKGHMSKYFVSGMF